MTRDVDDSISGFHNGDLLREQTYESQRLATRVVDTFLAIVESLPEHSLAAATGTLARGVRDLRQVHQDAMTFESLSPDERSQLVQKWKYLVCEFDDFASDVFLRAKELRQVGLNRNNTMIAAPHSCSICLEVKPAVTIGLPCEHSFHCACAFRWVHTKHSCPLCRCHVPSLADCKFSE
jgi:Ring finger domain